MNLNAWLLTFCWPFNVWLVTDSTIKSASQLITGWIFVLSHIMYDAHKNCTLSIHTEPNAPVTFIYPDPFKRKPNPNPKSLSYYKIAVQSSSTMVVILLKKKQQVLFKVQMLPENLVPAELTTCVWTTCKCSHLLLEGGYCHSCSTVLNDKEEVKSQCWFTLIIENACRVDLTEHTLVDWPK